MAELSEADKAFLAYDWGQSKKWLDYFDSLYPTPPADKVLKWKKKFFKAHEVCLSLCLSSWISSFSSLSSSPSHGVYCCSHRSFGLLLPLMLLLLFLSLFLLLDSSLYSCVLVVFINEARGLSMILSIVFFGEPAYVRRRVLSFVSEVYVHS